MARMFERKDTRKFEFKPRYWDPAKEEREERERRIRAELQNEQGATEEEEGDYRPNLRGRLTELYRERKERRKGLNGRYAVRLFAVLIFVFLMLFYFMMKYGNSFIQSFM